MSRRRVRRLLGPVMALLLLGAAPLHAQEPAAAAPAADAEAQSAEELAKKLANPISSLISVPFQYNYDAGFGPGDEDRHLVNIQPVVPLSISTGWNLISRTIVPVVSQEDIPPGSGHTFGIGDVVQSVFFSPKEPTAGWIWGAGPVFLLPTASDDLLGADKWGAGPTAVALRQSGPWTWGMLANHVWSFGGSGRNDVNATFLQPFLTWTTKTGFGVFLNSESTYDWEATQWSVPVNLGASQVLTVGSQRIQLGLGVRHWVETPRGGPDWGLRANVVLLFPR